MICLEFLQYCHSGRCLSLYVIKVAMKPSVIIRRVVPLVKRLSAAFIPYSLRFIPGWRSLRFVVDELILEHAWLQSSVCFPLPDDATVASCSSVTVFLRCAIPLTRQNPLSSLAENVGYKEESYWPIVLLLITDNCWYWISKYTCVNYYGRCLALGVYRPFLYGK